MPRRPTTSKGTSALSIPGPGLTALGHEQAGAIPAAIEGEGHPGHLRLDHGAHRAHRGAPCRRPRTRGSSDRRASREIGAGDFEGRSDRESIHAYMGTIISWWQDPSARIPGSENGNEFFAPVHRGGGAHRGQPRWHSRDRESRCVAPPPGRPRTSAQHRRGVQPHPRLAQHGDDRARGVAGGGLGRDATGTASPWAAPNSTTRRRSTPPVRRTDSTGAGQPTRTNQLTCTGQLTCPVS